MREASPETWVFLEKVELPVPLDPEESVGSLESEELLALRVCRGPEVCRELLGLTDQRELLDLQVPQEVRDPRVCKACLEREEVLAFLDPKETEVT